jgi:hypothetical protein
MPDQRNKIYSVKKRAQKVAKSEDKWNIFINTLSLGLVFGIEYIQIYSSIHLN